MRFTTQLPAALATILLAACGGSNSSSSPTTVALTAENGKAIAKVAAGELTGLASPSTISFLGIPYAKPPVGDLRWQPPVAPAAWSGNLDATSFAKHCPQENAQADPNASEDCLFLNVHVPKAVAADRTAKRPVMVWIHGGANAFGASDFYDPAPLLDAGDVVVVTLNYRLGALGFVAHPALRTNGGRAVNYGVMDQQLALQWVRDNIAAFGGDPANVTLFGESAGGLNTTTHLISESSRGLFQKAIIESGGYLLETPSLAAADAKGRTFSAKVGCADQSASCLRSRSVAQILAAQGTVNTDSAAYYQMVLDGSILKESHESALAAGRFSRVPVLLGANSNEGRLFVSGTAKAEDYQATVSYYSDFYHRDPAKTTAMYPLPAYPNAFEAASAVLGDSAFSCPARKTANWLAKYVPTYSYEFSDAASLLGSAHFSEIYYLFNYQNSTGMGVKGNTDSQALALAMRRYWTSFARSGNPNTVGVADWPAYRPEANNLQLLVPPAPKGDNSPAQSSYVARHKCDYWGT